ncbi:amidase [Heyndrickxia oleronia]|uniref:Amidase n=1 Tax=Heyndrickxia oleronia TaxID=38875 RepID=A0AAW6STI6_9BACI|nr:amidase [Heyndrickxia oleronia]MDH5159336.1 amidase [Heyndrickxia oleronia]
MDKEVYLTHDGVSLANLIKKKEVSPKELVEAAYEQMEAVNPHLNAVVRTRKEKVMEEIDQLHIEEQPFAGVPIVLKDISQSIKGEPLTSGSKLFINNISKRDSNFVDRLRKAGFLFLGHTNTPEFGLKNITEPEIYGPTRNPWNTNYSAGGSSGGSAASVASGIVPIAGASDGGGSIRIPASFTGLFGLKPTRGRTPVGPGVGRQWQGASIDFVLSRSVRDSAALLDFLQTIQPEAAFHIPLFDGSYYEEMKKKANKKFRIAFTTKSPVGTPVDEEAKLAIYKTVQWLEEQGYEVEEKSNNVDGIRLMENYYIMNNGEMAGMVDSIEKSLGRAITANDMEIVSWVLTVAGKSVTAAEFTQSIAEWDLAAAQMAEFHKNYDLYLTPATANSAPKIGELTQNENEISELMKISELTKNEQLKLVYDMFEPSLTYTPFTQLANLTGQPAISVPVHLTKNGLPLGVQFMAPKGKEHWLFKIAGEIEDSDLWIGMKGNPLLANA